jgi:LmbE family N-acetylglucosaminyl deacetylase
MPDSDGPIETAGALTVDFTIDLPAPRRALAVGAHPDDIEFGCGATLAKWSLAGTDVHLLVLTDGSKGTWDPGADTAALVEQRRREQRAAADVLGASAVHFCDFVDGELDSTAPGRAAVCEVIRRVRPDVLLGHDPWKRYRLHPDHHHAGQLVVDGLVAARDPHFFPEQRLAPHRPERLLLFEPDVPDHFEDIAVTLPTKLLALLCHRSQWRSTMGIDDAAPDFEAPDFEAPHFEAQREAFATRIRDEAKHQGDPAGLALAEHFKRIEPL